MDYHHNHSRKDTYHYTHKRCTPDCECNAFPCLSCDCQDCVWSMAGEPENTPANRGAYYLGLFAIAVCEAIRDEISRIYLERLALED